MRIGSWVVAAVLGLVIAWGGVGCGQPASGPEPALTKAPGTTIVHTGGASEWIETDEGYELKIYFGEEDGVARGLSPALAASIFASGSGACGTREDQMTFRCVDKGCNRDCRIWSADKNSDDDSTNRVETPNEEGFVYCMPDRVYWCKCE